MDDAPALSLACEGRFSCHCEGNRAILCREERMVFADRYILAGEDLCTALADNNVTRFYFFTGIPLNPQVLWV